MQIKDNLQIDSIIVIADADEKTPDQIEKSIIFDGIKFEENKLVSNKIINNFGTFKNINSFLRIIPRNNSGALENLILDSIKINDKTIVDESNKFVDTLPPEGKKYLKHKRMILKAKTGVVFSLIKPDSTFSELKEKFELANCNTNIIFENFRFLKELIK
jgi:hypothetical protein